MSRFSLFFIAAITFIGGTASISAQSVKTTCGIEAAWQQAVQRDPSLVQKRAQMEARIDQYLQARKSARLMGPDDDSALLIIPTVFHIIEEGGGEDIADANIRSCIQITNTDFRRQNADTANTPTALYFKSRGADVKIEFRLATIDPNGNPTNGITRTYSHRTEDFGSYDQELIDWDPAKYMNVWVVHDINNGPLVGGIVIGYAGFPLTNFSATDGVVLRYDFVGNLPPANVVIPYAGRDGDHEIGHYLNLIHIWGDADCGDDKCADTPTQATSSSGCPALGDSTLSCNGDTAMTNNYMDYSDGGCKSIFTQDQAARMRATMYTARWSMWQQSNLVATGTDSATYSLNNANFNNPPIAPKADFLVYPSAAVPSVGYGLSAVVCPGKTVSFSSDLAVTNGTPTSWAWSFPGGNPATSTSPDPASVTYANPGIYPVTLTVSNAQGTSSITKDSAVFVDYGNGQIAAPFSESFEHFGGNAWGWSSYNDDGGPGWQVTDRAAYSGNYSMSIQNYLVTAPGSVKELYTVPYDLRAIFSGGQLNFRLAYGRYWQFNNDSLSVDASYDCGGSWAEIGRFATRGTPPGNALSTSGGYQANDFVPTHDQWQAVSISLSAVYNRKPNVKFRFYFRGDIYSNNLYIDDINVSATVVGINEVADQHFTFSADPNPASGFFTLSYELKHAADLTIGLYDLQGRLIRQLESKRETTGSYENRIDASSFNLASGIYLIKMTTADGAMTKKLVYSNN